jgi:hypothetical protein
MMLARGSLPYGWIFMETMIGKVLNESCQSMFHTYRLFIAINTFAKSKMSAKELGSPEILAKIDKLRELNVGSIIPLSQVRSISALSQETMINLRASLSLLVINPQGRAE